MSGEPDPLLVVNQLRDLAADPLNRRAIIQDQGCLPGLILFLGNANPQVVYSALLVSRPRTHRHFRGSAPCGRHRSHRLVVAPRRSGTWQSAEPTGRSCAGRWACCGASRASRTSESSFVHES